MANGITRETFEGMDQNSQMLVLFDYAKESHQCSCNTETKLNELEKKFDKRKRFDTGVSTLAGIVSGALSALGVKIGG